AKAPAAVTLARVDAANDRIILKNHGFTVGQTYDVSYESLADNGINPVGGLGNEESYNLVAVDANTFELFDQTTGAKINLSDPGGGARHLLSYISAVKSFNPTTAVDSNLDTITIANHGLKDGDEVVYGVDPTKINAQSRAFDLDAIDTVNDTIHIVGHGFET